MPDFNPDDFDPDGKGPEYGNTYGKRGAWRVVRMS